MNVLTIEKAVLEKHKSEIISIMGRNLENILEKDFAWKYEESPHGTARCWLIKDNNANCYVGSAAIFPRYLYINGKRTTAFVAGDFSVDNHHRSFGPALRLQREILSYVVEYKPPGIVYGLPNRFSEPIFKRVGYRQIGHYGRYVKLLRIGDTVSTKFSSWGKIIKNINPALKYLSRDFYYRNPTGVSVEINDNFDSRFDDLFDRIKNKDMILSDRKSEYMNWRYMGSQLLRNNVFSILRDKHLYGYVTYNIKSENCYIKDVLCDETDNMLDVLFSEFIRYCRNNKVETINIYYYGSNTFKKMLRRHGFILRMPEEKLYVYLKDNEIQQHIYKENKWHFLAGDND